MRGLPFRSLIPGLLASLSILVLQGCSEYLDRHDRIAMSAGDAIAANKATHVVDPWPRDGFNTNPRTIGQRAAIPVQRYRDGVSRPGSGGTSSPATGGAVQTAAGGTTTGQ